MKRKIQDAEAAKTVWSLYRKYGIGEFPNWLTMNLELLTRDEVVAALRFPETKKMAAEAIQHYHSKTKEIESMLNDSGPA